MKITKINLYEIIKIILLPISLPILLLLMLISKKNIDFAYIDKEDLNISSRIWKELNSLNDKKWIKTNKHLYPLKRQLEEILQIANIQIIVKEFTLNRVPFLLRFIGVKAIFYSTYICQKAL